MIQVSSQTFQFNDNQSRRTLSERYEDVIEAEVTPRAQSLEAAVRIFRRQLSDARLRRLRRAMINQKRYGTLSGAQK